MLIYAYFRIFLLAGSATAGFLIWHVRKRRSSAWPMVNATIENFHLIQDGSSPVPVLHYSYSVQNEFYSGELQPRDFPTDADAVDRMCRSLQGQRILVRYNPQRPDTSIYINADQAAGAPRSGFSLRGWLAEHAVFRLRD